MIDEAEESDSGASCPEKRAMLGLLLEHYCLNLTERQ
jgi:hypothetical protein